MPKRTTPAEFLLPLALLAFAGFWFHALARPAPAPPPVQDIRIELPPGAVADAPAAPYERGTQRWPLIVDFADTPASRQGAASAAAYRQEEETANRRVLLVCGLLGFLAFIQFLAMIVQAYWMKRWVQMGENRGSNSHR